MAITLHDNKIIYILIPKVGCTTIRHFLSLVRGKEWVIDENNEAHPVWIGSGPGFDEVSLKDFKDYPDYFKFAFVRNPLDRLVSCYFEKVVKVQTMPDNSGVEDGMYKCFRVYPYDFRTMSFSDFASFVFSLPLANMDVHFRPQYTFLPEDLNTLDFIGRFENFNQDLNIIKEKLNISHEHKHLYKSKHDHYMNYYDSDLKKKAQKVYEADIELFGYDKK